jgi:hypothetical protein
LISRLSALKRAGVKSGASRRASSKQVRAVAEYPRYATSEPRASQTTGSSGWSAR